MGVAHKNIGDENTVKLSLLKKLSQFYPVTDVVKIPRFIIWMSPKTRRLMTTARFNKGVDDELLLGLGGLLRFRHFGYNLALNVESMRVKERGYDNVSE